MQRLGLPPRHAPRRRLPQRRLHGRGAACDAVDAQHRAVEDAGDVEVAEAVRAVGSCGLPDARIRRAGTAPL
eukprot:8542626-Lingulodinium_polyedra.AAC.1